ncbi:(Na+)-NQR maturation NqrM [Alteromonas oceanisediminis]|uniref:(Na+)-NQR maturation NqrM n=1 Tax=Alteromonas oceanisediminis TaxID=2836180 RepID=UPI001BD91B93|nr:(Na+)-NQR maturation NqrM [Alteromonas oceanisediminis]MBT0585903.1 (Na+)-NQR maturation NqrM [Alteromonas oceanisediminis]
MSTFILAFVFFLAMVLAMAVGYVFQRKTIAGSCGGLGAIGISKACDCPEPCDRKLARMAREEARQEKLAEWQKNKII